MLVIKAFAPNNPRMCILWHSWRKKADTRHNTYFECRDCGSRMVVQQDGGYQPIDFRWLYNEHKRKS